MKNIDSVISSEVYSLLKNFDKNDYKKLENITNKTISVLLEAGLFSSALFVKYQGSKREFSNSSSFMLSLIVDILEKNKDILNINTKTQTNDNYDKLIEYLKEITKDVYLTVFTTNIIYQALVYLRYHLKAK